MFESIVIRRHSTKAESSIDVGLLAETLLFYEHVHILLDGAGLRSLLRSIGADNLLGLLSQRRVRASFLADNLGTRTDTVNNVSLHNYAAFRVVAHPDGRPFKRKEWIRQAFDEVLGASRMTSIKSDRFLRHISFKQHQEPNSGIETGLIGAATADLRDPNYVRRAVELTLKEFLPNVSTNDVIFDVVPVGEQFIVSTNLDFVRINEMYRRMYCTSEGPVAPAWLLGQILDARADMYFAADYMAEFATDPLRSKLIQSRLSDLLRRRTASSEDIGAFQEFTLDNGYAIREALNSGSKTFDEFLKVLDQADRFKEWLRNNNPDAHLLKEYHEAATKHTWLESLPAKAMRFVVCSIAGISLAAIAPEAIGVGIEATAGALDAMMLDKLMKGWRPNQFIEGPLRRFVDE